MVEEYGWARTLAAGRSCCGRSGSTVLVLGLQLVHTYAVDHMYRPTHLRRTAVGLRNVSENLGAEILNNLNSLAKNLLIERLHVHLTPTKFKQLLAEKS